MTLNVFYASNAGSGTLSGYGDDGSGTLESLGTTATGAEGIAASRPRPAGY